MRHLRILNIVPYYPPAYSYGGPVKGVYEMSKELVSRGHSVDVLTTDVLDKNLRSKLPFKSFEDGITVYRVKNISNFLANRFNFYLSLELGKFIELENKYDIVHYHDFRSPNNYFLSKYFEIKAIPQVLAPYGSMNKFNKKIIKNIYDALFGHSVTRRISNFIAVNDIEKDFIENYTDKKVSIIPNSIDLNNIKSSKFDVREHFNLPNKKIILYLGRIHQLKNPDILLKAYKGLSQEEQSQSIVLIIGPDNGYSETLRKLSIELNIEDSVFIDSEFIGDEKWEILHQSDVFVLPSNDQASPLTMLEAISQNLPVVTSEKALEETLPAELGKVVNFEIIEFSKYISEYLKRDKPKNGFEFIRDNYSVKSYCDQLENLYQEVINENSTRS